MITDERFNELWQGLREQVKQAREKGSDRDSVNTIEDREERHSYGGRVSIGGGDEDGATMHVHRVGGSVNVSCEATALLSIAAHCIAAAEEIREAKEEAAKVRPNMQRA